jgi:hypothetical protein
MSSNVSRPRVFSLHNIIGLAKRYRIILAVITLLLVIHHTGQTAHVNHHFQTPGETYTPGKDSDRFWRSVMRRLVRPPRDRERKMHGVFSPIPRDRTCSPSSPTRRRTRMTKLWNARDMKNRTNVKDGPDERQTCWRLKLYKQLSVWEPHHGFK